MTSVEKESAVRRLWSVVLTAVLLVAASGCETTVDVELPDHEPQLVVNDLFTAGNRWGVAVTESRSLQQNDWERFPPVENATVVILKDGQVVDTLPLANEAEGVYRSTSGRRPQAGTEYTIQVTAPGFETAEAASRAPAPVPFTLSRGDMPPETRELELAITDPEGQDNYYALSVYHDIYRADTLVDRIPLSFTSSSPLLRENLRQDFEGEEQQHYRHPIFSDAAFQGNTRRVTIRFERRGDGCCFTDPVERRRFVVLTSLSEDSYEYQRTVKRAQNTDDNPFAEPAQVYSNVRGGLGIFGGGTWVTRSF